MIALSISPNFSPRVSQKLLEQDRVFVGGAARLRHRPPFGADLLAVMNGENDVGVTGVDGKQHVYLAKNTSPAAMVRVAV